MCFAVIFTGCFFVVTSSYSLLLLFLFDFRPYHVGANIREGMEIPEGAKMPRYENTFVMEKNGERREFTLDNYTDSTWTFVERKSELVEEG